VVERKTHTHQEILLKNGEEATAVLGQYDRNIALIREAFAVRVTHRGDTVRIEGPEEDVERVSSLFQKLREVVESGHVPTPDEVRYLAQQVKESEGLEGVLAEPIQTTHWGEQIRPKTVGPGQVRPSDPRERYRLWDRAVRDGQDVPGRRRCD
jgi:phosphate starvation-inducible protein PhoH